MDHFVNVESKYKMDIYMEFLESKSLEYNEIVKNLNVEHFLTTNLDLNINELINFLKSLGYPLSRKLISYYYFDAEMYVQCGLDPLDIPVYINWSEISSRRLLRLRIKNRDDRFIHILMTEEVNE